MEEFEKQVRNTMNQYNLIEEGDRIVVCVSGGPDSICLLDILNTLQKEYGIHLLVAHVNHGIREEAEEDENYVKDYCLKNQIPCFVKRANVIEEAKKQKRGLEETGRMVRYDFFEEIRKQENANKIAIAHNLNDKIETILMNIIRGTGTAGLKGIEPKRDKIYIRPLIETSRIEIEKYCEEKELHPRWDKTNENNTYTRNRIRNVLLPLLEKEFNPNILEAIQKLSEISMEEQNYFQKIVHTTYKEIVLEENQKEIVLDLKKFNQQDLVIKRKLILYTINRLMGSTKNIEKIHVEDMITLCERNIGNKYLTPNKNIRVFIKKGKIFWESKV